MFDPGPGPLSEGGEVDLEQLGRFLRACDRNFRVGNCVDFHIFRHLLLGVVMG